MNKKLKSSISIVVLSSIISTNISPTISAFAYSEDIIKVNNLIQQEVTEQEITEQEVTEQEITEQEVTEQEITEQEVTEQEVTEQEVTEQEVTEQEVTEQEVTEQEVTEQEVTEQEVTEGQDRSNPKYGVKGGFSSIWTIVVSIISFAQNYQYIKDSFQSIRLQFKINMLGLQIRSYDTAHWVGTGCTNNSTIVKKVQKALNLKYPNLTPLSEDGIVGSLTIARIKKFQTDQGLPADGACGENTYKALFNLKNQ